MKCFVLILVVIAGTTVAQNHHADFSGKWKLNLKKSKDLSESFRAVTSYTMEVAQTTDSMVVGREMTGEGQTVNFPPTVYKFDNSEVYREDTLRGSKRWIRSSWTTTGEKLIVTNRVALKQRAGEQRYTETDVWEFGKKNTLLLLVTQKYEKNDSTHSEQRVFNRVR